MAPPVGHSLALFFDEVVYAVLADGPVMSHVAVVGQDKDRDTGRDLGKLSLHIAEGPGKFGTDGHLLFIKNIYVNKLLVANKVDSLFATKS